MGEEREVSRRDFLANAAMTVGVVASFGVAGAHAVRFILPPEKKGRPVEVLMATLDELPPGASKEFLYGAGRKGILVNVDGKIKTFSKICTHLGCEVEWIPDKRIFFCPCHEGVFDENGVNVSGPPPRPLDEFEVKVEGNNIFVKVMEA